MLAAALLLAGCGTSTAPSLRQQSTIKIFTDTSAEVQNDELVNLYVRTEGLSGVTKVEFYRDGKLLGSDTAAPYAWLDEVGRNEKYTYQAVAYTAQVKDYSEELDVLPKLRPTLTTLQGKLHDVTGALNRPLTLQPWTGGAGKVSLGWGDAVFTQGNLAEDGNFSVTLGTPPDLSLIPLTPASLVALVGLENCTGDATVFSATGAATAPQMRLARAQVTANRSGYTAPLVTLPPTVVSVGGQQKQTSYYNLGTLLYASNAATLRGSLTCPHAGSGKTEVNFTLFLKKGWNKVTQFLTISPANPALSRLTYTTGFPQTDGSEPWVLLPSSAFPLTP